MESLEALQPVGSPSSFRGWNKAQWISEPSDNNSCWCQIGSGAVPRGKTELWGGNGPFRQWAMEGGGSIPCCFLFSGRLLLWATPSGFFFSAESFFSSSLSAEAL